MKILWAPLAIDRASEIAEYIAQDKPSAAAKWIDDEINHLKLSNLISQQSIGIVSQIPVY